MIKREEEKKKDLYQSLSMDTIIESCLILMVLLLLTCARHLIVDCTALDSPIYSVTCPAEATRWCCVCQTVSPTLPFTPPPSPFSELSSKCHSVCYKSCNSSLCFMAFHAGSNLEEVCRPPSQKKTKKTFQWGGKLGRETHR